MGITLKVAETSPKFVGRGIAIVDPRVIDKEGLATRDVIEISGKKKSYVLLRPSEPEDHGRSLIRIDGYIRNPEIFERIGIEAPKGVLLFGPPGIGKTMIAKTVATTSEANFISVKGPEILSKWVGESEKAVREVFRKARLAAPCVVFFDEVDAIAPRRGSDGDSHVAERVISQMLTELDGLEDLKGVLIVGATNRPDIIDESLLRPGRFDRILEVPGPDAEAREEIIKIHTVKKPLDTSVDLDKVVETTDGMTGADIAAVVNAAAMAAIKEQIFAGGKGRIKITNGHFEKALQKIKRKVGVVRDTLP